MPSTARAILIVLVTCFGVACTASQDLGERPDAVAPDGGGTEGDGGSAGMDARTPPSADATAAEDGSADGAALEAAVDGGTPDGSMPDGAATDGAAPDASDASSVDDATASDGGGPDQDAADSSTAGCLVAGTFYTPGAMDPANACQSCQPVASTSDWTNAVDGTSCSGGVCARGVCGPPTQGACTPGARRCNVGDAVEICSGSGSSWLYSTTCSSGCSSGECTGGCSTGALRCNGDNVQVCNANTWSVQQECSTYCAGSGQCALDGLPITTNTNLDGEVFVQGEVHVYTGATLTSPTGNLTLHADTITVDLGGSIVAAATGLNSRGAGHNGTYTLTVGAVCLLAQSGGAGGSYGSAGGGGPAAWGSSVDSEVDPGSPGGSPGESPGVPLPPGGSGGGVLRLYASTVTIAGQVSANGLPGQANLAEGSTYGGGGSGGGILVAADSVTISGAVSAVGGASEGTSSQCVAAAGPGGNGRVKILWGSAHSITGTLSGTVSQALLPPIPITSTSDPNPALVYNDGLPSLLLSWNKAFPSVAEYFALLDTSASGPPTAASGLLVTTDYTSFAPSALVAGANYFHIVPVDTASNVGTVETVFEVQINSSGPTVSSTTHPDPTAWSTNVNPDFAWSFPQGDASVSGSYYVFDHEGLTLPDTLATFVPVSQKTLLITGVQSGVWVFHVVSVDTGGNRTKAASHYRINIGTDPGSGSLVGTVVDGSSSPVSGATVSVNNGLYAQATNAAGQYNIATMTAGTWQVTASASGHSAAATATVTSGGATTQNFVLQ
jgi:hypothetical protein